MIFFPLKENFYKQKFNFSYDNYYFLVYPQLLPNVVPYASLLLFCNSLRSRLDSNSEPGGTTASVSESSFYLILVPKKIDSFEFIFLT